MFCRIKYEHSILIKRLTWSLLALKLLYLSFTAQNQLDILKKLNCKSTLQKIWSKFVCFCFQNWKYLSNIFSQTFVILLECLRSQKCFILTISSVGKELLLDDLGQRGVDRLVPGVGLVHEDLHGGVPDLVGGLELDLVLDQDIEQVGVVHVHRVLAVAIVK